MNEPDSDGRAFDLSFPADAPARPERIENDAERVPDAVWNVLTADWLAEWDED